MSSISRSAASSARDTAFTGKLVDVHPGPGDDAECEKTGRTKIIQLTYILAKHYGLLE
jgi:hypothetical protein